MLEKQVGKEEAKHRIVAVTDRAKGALRSLATKEGYTTFVIPDNVGGRFSVLTPVGLLPIAVAGGDIKALVKGAQDAIVSHMYIDKCTVARRTKRLEELGYISRETGKEDRRENNLYVTESGEKLVPVIREILQDWAKSVTRDLSDEERILLITLLDRLIHTDVE